MGIKDLRFPRPGLLALEILHEDQVTNKDQPEYRDAASQTGQDCSGPEGAPLGKAVDPVNRSVRSGVDDLQERFILRAIRPGGLMLCRI